MKKLYFVIILIIPISFVGSIGFIVFSTPHGSNESIHVVTNQINGTSVSQDNGSVFADVNPNTNRIYIANEVSNTVSVIDGSNNAKIASIQVGILPLKLAVNPNTNRIYVTEHHVVNNIEQNGTVSVIDGSNNAKIASIQVGVNPSGIAVNPNTNRIYVTNYNEGTVSVIDGNSDTIVGKPIQLDSGVEGIAVNHLTNKLYVSNGITTTVYVIDGDTGSKVDEIQKLSAWNVAVNPTTNRIYVPSYFFNNLSVIDGRYDNVMKIIPIGMYPD